MGAQKQVGRRFHDSFGSVGFPHLTVNSVSSFRIMWNTFGHYFGGFGVKSTKRQFFVADCCRFHHSTGCTSTRFAFRANVGQFQRCVLANQALLDEKLHETTRLGGEHCGLKPLWHSEPCRITDRHRGSKREYKLAIACCSLRRANCPR